MHQQTRRPFGIVVIVLVQVAVALTYGGTVIAVYGFGYADRFSLLGGSEVYRVISLTMELFTLVIALGLWRLRRWAWVLFMTRLGLDMGLDLFFYTRGEAHFFSMIINVLMVFYLNQTEVRLVFRRQEQVPPPVEGTR